MGTGSPAHKYTGTSVHRCTGTHVHQYTGIPVYWHTDTPGHQYTGTPNRLIHECPGPQVHWYTNTLVHRYRSTPVHQYTGTQVHPYPSTSGSNSIFPGCHDCLPLLVLTIAMLEMVAFPTFEATSTQQIYLYIHDLIYLPHDFNVLVLSVIFTLREHAPPP